MAKKEPKKYLRKAVGMIIGLIGIFLLIFIVFYTFSRYFRAQELAVMLPHDSVVTVVQINVDENSDQVKRLFTALQGYAVYDPRIIKAAVNELFDTDYDNKVKPWLNRQIGLAIIENKAIKGQTDMLFFAEVKDKEKAIEFMQDRGLKDQEDYIVSEDYRGNKIYKYSLSQTYSFIFMKNHMVIALTREPLKVIIDAVEVDEKQLIDNEKYKKIVQNLPINTISFAYVDVQKANEVLASNEQFMSEKGQQLLAFKPFIDLYKSAGVAITIDNATLALQSFVALDKEYLDDEDLISFDTKFRANLLSLMPSDLAFYSGGLNMQNQLYKYSELFNRGGEVSYLIFEGALRSVKNQYLGEEITLEADIYPFLSGEYAFAYSPGEAKGSYIAIIELEDPLRDKELVENVFDSFIRKSAILAPKVVEVELEDGTVMEEIKVSPEEIKRSTEDYHGYEMELLTVGSQTWGINYLVLDDNLVITTQKESLQSVIDLFIESKDSMKDSASFSTIISPVLRTSDEAIYLNLAYFYEEMKNELPAEVVLYLEPFKEFSAGRNYFKDGISTINYIKIE